MIDVFSGPRAPLALVCKLCGWAATARDKLLSPDHDLSSASNRRILNDDSSNVVFLAVALPCDSKTRIREIPRIFPDGRPAPGPLRSEEYPEGLPTLKGNNKQRVEQGNTVTNFVLDLQQRQVDKGLGAMRENPTRSLEWWQPKQVEIWATGQWLEQCYAACALMGIRCKQQTLRHCIPEIDQWPPVHCNHVHDCNEWKPRIVHGCKYYPSQEEAEYTASLCFLILIAVTVPMWAIRKGFAKMKLPRIPQVMPHGERVTWLQVGPHITREWAMLPMAVQLGIDIQLPSVKQLPARRSTEELNFVQAQKEPARLPADHVYVGPGMA